MPDPSNALAWSQSPPQFSQPQPFGNAQPAPDYNDALSQAWHQSYSRNNPADYEANYRQPSAYDHITAALHSAAQATDPFGGAASDPNPVTGATRGIGTALRGIPAIGGPMAVFDAASNALSPTAVGSAERLQNWGGTDLQNTRINKLMEENQSLTQQRINAALHAGGTSSTTTGHGRRSSTTTSSQPASEGTIKAITGPLDDQLAKNQDEIEQIKGAIKEGAPFSERHPNWNAGLTAAGPLLSAFTAFKGAQKFLAPGASPLARAGAAGGSAVAGGLEGLGIGSIRDYFDMQLDPETRAYKQAKAGIPSWLPESFHNVVGPLLGRHAQSEAGLSAAIGFPAGSLGGVLSKRSPANALAAPAASEAPAALAQPKALFKDPRTGKDVFMGAQGKLVRQDAIGRWLFHEGGKQAGGPHAPPGFLSGNALSAP